MFGVIMPAIGQLNSSNKQAFNKTYCNICAANSFQFNAAARLSLIYDLVTIDWLYSDIADKPHLSFKEYNCIKFHKPSTKKKVAPHLSKLSSLSCFMMGVKLSDNAQDEPTKKNRFLNRAYRGTMKKAKSVLSDSGLLKPLEQLVVQSQQFETADCKDPLQAAQATEDSYRLVINEVANHYRTIDQKITDVFSQFLGRYVYLFDALLDMDEDKEKKQFNVFNNLKLSKAEAVKYIEQNLMPLKQRCIEQMEDFCIERKERWLNLLNTLETKFYRFANPSGGSCCGGGSAAGSSYICCPTSGGGCCPLCPSSCPICPGSGCCPCCGCCCPCCGGGK